MSIPQIEKLMRQKPPMTANIHGCQWLDKCSKISLKNLNILTHCLGKYVTEVTAGGVSVLSFYL